MKQKSKRMNDRTKKKIHSHLCLYLDYVHTNLAKLTRLLSFVSLCGLIWMWYRFIIRWLAKIIMKRKPSHTQSYGKQEQGNSATEIATENLRLNDYENFQMNWASARIHCSNTESNERQQQPAEHSNENIETACLRSPRVTIHYIEILFNSDLL